MNTHRTRNPPLSSKNIVNSAFNSKQCKSKLYCLGMRLSPVWHWHKVMRWVILSVCLAGMTGACFISPAPDVRGWRCQQDSDCMGVLLCWNGRCRMPCEDALDCQSALEEICRNGLCLPPCEEGDTRPCYTGPPQTQDVGICKAGQQTCTSQQRWGSCRGEVLPREESCNQQDDNCNGKIDDGISCECNIGDKRPCYTKSKGCVKVNDRYNCTGVCKPGEQVCEAGPKWGPCIGETTPTDRETCNGLDDTCDGYIDNNVPEVGQKCAVPGQLGPCADGIYECKQGSLLCKQMHFSVREICDNIDNDCDGKVDNNPGGSAYSLSRPCYTAQIGCKLESGKYNCNLPCQSGAQLCLSKQGVWATTCLGEITPKPEECNGIDDDCDGVIDNDAPCPQGQKCINGQCG